MKLSKLIVGQGKKEMSEFIKKKQVDSEWDFYVLKMYGCVEPMFVGPFTEAVANERLEEYVEDPAESQNAHSIIRITKGAEIN